MRLVKLFFSVLAIMIVATLALIKIETMYRDCRPPVSLVFMRIPGIDMGFVRNNSKEETLDITASVTYHGKSTLTEKTKLAPGKELSIGPVIEGCAIRVKAAGYFAPYCFDVSGLR